MRDYNLGESSVLLIFNSLISRDDILALDESAEPTIPELSIGSVPGVGTSDSVSQKILLLRGETSINNCILSLSLPSAQPKRVTRFEVLATTDVYHISAVKMPFAKLAAWCGVVSGRGNTASPSSGSRCALEDRVLLDGDDPNLIDS